MLTTLVSIFLSIFGALRAAPLYYTRVLTLGSAFKSYATLDDSTTTTIRVIDSFSSTPVLRMPPSPVLLTLPTGVSSDSLAHSLAFLAAVFVITIFFFGIIWHLRTSTLALGNDDTNMQAGDSEKMHHLVIDLSGVTYNGHMLASDVKFQAGLLADLTSMPLESSPPVDLHAASMQTSEHDALDPPSCVVSREDSKNDFPASSKATSAPTYVPPKSEAIDCVTVPAEPTPADEEDDDDAWDTWTNRRHRRPPRQAPLSASIPTPSRTRSSSVNSTLRTSDTLFSSVSAASTAPTSAASSRRSSIAAFSPGAKRSASAFNSLPIRTTRSVTSHNRFLALEVFEVAE
ncbi:hypothetical protein TRAPUB_8476 [Trametes pubescens]|uniref:STAS domain-containing protein n=1 Tax=Trametes pubescens TaxID=154538 RepID=A0A1M2W5F5_TRAPU|nr:hypothetical protein TRAPUB_8476 [Trametes pubescens]